MKRPLIEQASADALVAASGQGLAITRAPAMLLDHIGTLISEAAPIRRAVPMTVAEVKAHLIGTESRIANDIARRSAGRSRHPASRWPDRYVSDDDTRQYLKAWIWCEAHGESFARLCRERAGWSQRTGSRRVADGLNSIVTRLSAEAEALGVTVAAPAQRSTGR
ncbi:hypothetical protein [Methylobacterium sp. JK268]